MKKSGLKVLSISFVIILMLFSSPAAAEDFYAGDVINLGGSSPSNYVYLFVVGPNLPSGGANPEDIQSAVVTDDPDSFVRVTVNSGRWNYKWDTSTASGTPDAGVYRVYAASKPVALSDVSSADYSVTVVNIVRPYVTAGAEGGMITAKTGVVNVDSAKDVYAESGAADSLPEREAEPLSGTVYRDDNRSTGNSDSSDGNYKGDFVTGVSKTAEDTESDSESASAPSEESGLSAAVSVSAIGIFSLILYTLRRKG